MFVDNKSDITPEMEQALRDTISQNPQLAAKAAHIVKSALVTPLQRGIVMGDTVTGIFNMQAFDWGVHPEYPLDAVSPSEIKLHVAYTMPKEGYIPQRNIEGDYIMVSTYRIATSCDWSRIYARSARWDVVGRAFAVAEAGMVRKRNNDGWRTLISSAADRGISVVDSTAAAGLFTKRLVALGETVMRRNAGGNSTSTDRGRLTHMAISPESLQDVRSWDATQVDDFTRREIFLKADGYALTKIFGVELIDIDEFGEGQEYQLYYNNVLGGTTPSSKNEIAIGLDLTNGLSDAFVMPWRKAPDGGFLEAHDDPTLLRHNRAGFFLQGWYGVAVLDSRRALLLAI